MSRKMVGKRQEHRVSNPASKLSRGWMRTLLRSNAGQSLVEVAVVFPILSLLVLGATEFGRLSFAGIEVTNAARAAVQYGAQNHVTASDTTGMQNAAVNDAKNVSGLSATATQVCYCASDLTTTVACQLTSCQGSVPASSRLLLFVQVNTSATVNPLFHYPGSPQSFRMTGQAVMRVQQ